MEPVPITKIMEIKTLADCMKTIKFPATSTPNLEKITALFTTDIPSVEDLEEGESQEGFFHLLSPAQKRFYVLFYLTASLTGLAIVQLIWQIAVLTSR